MGFSKKAAPVLEKPEVAAPVQSVPPTAAAGSPVVVQQHITAVEYSPEEKKVRGQVRMHALMAGYKVAALLAPTLANTSTQIKEELKKLAHEVAEDIERYSFL